MLQNSRWFGHTLAGGTSMNCLTMAAADPITSMHWVRVASYFLFSVAIFLVVLLEGFKGFDCRAVFSSIRVRKELSGLTDVDDDGDNDLPSIAPPSLRRLLLASSSFAFVHRSFASCLVCSSSSRRLSDAGSPYRPLISSFAFCFTCSTFFSSRKRFRSLAE
jgi:hypothetical protein